jgi:hypothetical protein
MKKEIYEARHVRGRTTGYDSEGGDAGFAW